MNKYVGLRRRVSTVHPSFPISGNVGDHAGYHNVHLPSQGEGSRLALASRRRHS